MDTILRDTIYHMESISALNLNLNSNNSMYNLTSRNETNKYNTDLHMKNTLLLKCNKIN